MRFHDNCVVRMVFLVNMFTLHINKKKKKNTQAYDKHITHTHEKKKNKQLHADT